MCFTLFDEESWSPTHSGGLDASGCIVDLSVDIFREEIILIKLPVIGTGRLRMQFMYVQL